MTALQKTAELISLYLEKGEHINDEFPHISIIEHGLKTAELAFQKGYTNDIIIACLLLDIKHLINEDINNYLIRLGINDNIRLIINNIVQTKRYMITLSNEFRKSSSSSSLLKMKYQGGLMNLDETVNFETNINYKVYVDVYKLYNDSIDADVKPHNILYYLNMIKKSIAHNIKN
jgi:predicted HD phosphohydrolase